MNAPSTTILIRARNEAALLGQCLEQISKQRTSVDWDVLLIDSGSTDDTVAIARSFSKVRVQQIRPKEFNYGATLNLGVSLAQSEFIVALSAHCVPTNEHWLEELVRPVVENERVAGSFGRQLPWPDCELVERQLLESTFSDQGYVQERADSPDPLTVLFSNANACLRRSEVLARPFLTLPFAEDRVWTHTILRSGRLIAYAPCAAVWHSHNRTIRGYYAVGRHIGETRAILGLRPRRLKDLNWFGLRRLYRRYHQWRRYAQSGNINAGQAAAVAALVREIAQSLGMWHGEHSPMRAVKCGQGSDCSENRRGAIAVESSGRFLQ